MADRIPSGRNRPIDTGTPASADRAKEGKPAATGNTAPAPEVRSRRKEKAPKPEQRGTGKSAPSVAEPPRLNAVGGSQKERKTPGRDAKPATQADTKLAGPPNSMFALPEDLHREIAKRMDLHSWVALSQTATGMRPKNQPGKFYAAQFSSAWLQFQTQSLRSQVQSLQQSREAFQYPEMVVANPKSKAEVEHFVNDIAENHAPLCVPLCNADLPEGRIWSSIQVPVLNALANHPKAKSIVLLVGSAKIHKNTREALSGLMARQVEGREITLVTENAGTVTKGLKRTSVWVFSQHKGESALTNLVLTYGDSAKTPDPKGVAACLKQHPNLRVLCLNVPGLLNNRDTDALASLEGHANLKRLVLVDANERNFIDGDIWQRLQPVLPDGLQSLEYVAENADGYTKGWTHIDSSAKQYLELLRPAGPDGRTLSLSGFSIGAAMQLLAQIDDQSGSVKTLRLSLGVANAEGHRAALNLVPIHGRYPAVEMIALILYDPGGVQAAEPQIIALLQQMKAMPQSLHLSLEVKGSRGGNSLNCSGGWDTEKIREQNPRMNEAMSALVEEAEAQ